MKGFKQFLENLFTHNVDDVIKDEGKVLDEVAKSNLFYSTIAKVRRLSDDLIHINIKSFEKSIQNEVDEFAKIYDEDGDTLINLLKGDSASVKISTSEIIKARKKLLSSGKKIDELIITHNHPPPGSSLSAEDIYLAMQHNAKKLRAINPDGTVFELVRKGSYQKDVLKFRINILDDLKINYSNLRKGSIEYQLKEADLAIEKLGSIVEYTQYK